MTTSTDKILAEYRDADFNRRLNMYLEFRRLRSEFIFIEKNDLDIDSSTITETSGKARKGPERSIEAQRQLSETRKGYSGLHSNFSLKSGAASRKAEVSLFDRLRSLIYFVRDGAFLRAMSGKRKGKVYAPTE